MVILVVFVVLLLFFYSRKVQSAWRYYAMVMKIPVGGKCVPLLGHTLTLAGPMNRTVKKAEVVVKSTKEKTNGPFIFWIGPVPILVLIQPKHIEVILSSTKYIDKPFHYDFLEPWLGKGLLTSTGSKWQSHRKMITPTFHFTILEQFVDVFAEKSLIMVKLLEKELGSDDFDILHYITLCALDIISETAMGVQLNAQQEEKQSEYTSAVYGISAEITRRCLSPWLYPEFLFNMSSRGKLVEKYRKIIHGLTNKIIRERREQFVCRESETSIAMDVVLGRKTKLFFLDLLLENSENGMNLTDEEIREEVDTFMFEGHDTTTSAIAWTIQIMATQPEVQEKVFEELQDILQGSENIPTIKHLNQMKYLERVIKETLRLYPSVPIFGRELKEDTELGIALGLKVL